MCLSLLIVDELVPQNCCAHFKGIFQVNYYFLFYSSSFLTFLLLHFHNKMLLAEVDSLEKVTLPLTMPCIVSAWHLLSPLPHYCCDWWDSIPKVLPEDSNSEYKEEFEVYF